MNDHKNTPNAIQHLKPLTDDQLKNIKGGLSIITLPGKELKAGNWTDIDLRLTSPKQSSRFSFTPKRV